MAEEQVMDTPQVEEPRSVNLEDEGSLVDDVIFGGEQDAFTEALEGDTSGDSIPAEPQQEPSVEVPQDNDQVRYQYWQSEADKLKNANEILTQQLQVQQQQPQAQPQQEEAVEEPEPDFPDPPEKPQQPYNFNMEEAMADPSSESARYVQAEQSWRDQMDEYKNLQFQFQMEMMKDEREKIRTERQQDIQRREAEAQQVEQMTNIKQHIMTQHKVDSQVADDFVRVMSDPTSINLDNLWKLYAQDKGYSSSPQPNIAPSKEFQQVKRAQQVPPSMGVMPSQNRQNEGSVEDKIMDSFISDFNKQNPFN